MYELERQCAAAITNNLSHEIGRILRHSVVPWQHTGVKPEAATLFTPDPYNTEGIIPVATSSIIEADDPRLIFQKDNIEKHRVDASCAAGQALDTDYISMGSSTMNPDHHQVINLPISKEPTALLL